MAGLAALIWGLDLGQTFAQVKQRILNGVEVKSGLNGMILTGGRINADNSVRNVPTPPSSLSAKVKSSSKIKLTWSDNSYGEDGFKIERKTDVGGIYAQVAVAAANSTSYTDTGLEKSTTYFYRIMAYRGTNNSEISNEANSTTSASDGGGGGGGGGGGCFITTAAFGSPTDTHVGVLRNSRARFPLSNRVGKMLARLYNHWSAALADFIEERETARVLTRWTLYPLVGLASIALHTTVGQQIAMGLTFLAIFYLVRFRRKSWC